MSFNWKTFIGQSVLLVFVMLFSTNGWARKCIFLDYISPLNFIPCLIANGEKSPGKSAQKRARGVRVDNSITAKGALVETRALSIETGLAYERSPARGHGRLPIPGQGVGVSLLKGLSEHFAFEGWLNGTSFWNNDCGEYYTTKCRRAGVSISGVARFDLFMVRGFHLFGGPGLSVRKYEKFDIYTLDETVVQGHRDDRIYRKIGSLHGTKINAGGQIGLGYKWNAGEHVVIGLDFISVFVRPLVVLKPSTQYDDEENIEDKKQVDKVVANELNNDSGRLGLLGLSLGLML